MPSQNHERSRHPSKPYLRRQGREKGDDGGQRDRIEAHIARIVATASDSPGQVQVQVQALGISQDLQGQNEKTAGMNGVDDGNLGSETNHTAPNGGTKVPKKDFEENRVETVSKTTINAEQDSNDTPIIIPKSSILTLSNPTKPFSTTSEIPIFPLPPLPPIPSASIRQKVFSHTSLFRRSRTSIQANNKGANGRPRAVFEDKIEEPTGHYEKLEFVGDSILGFIVSTWLHETKPRLSIGTATKLKSFLVSNATLAHLSTLYSLPAKLEADAMSAGIVRAQIDVRAALFEAYISGIYHSYSLIGQRNKAIDILDKWLRAVYSPLAEYFYNGMLYQYRYVEQISCKGPNGEDTTEYDERARGSASIVQQAAGNSGSVVEYKEEKVDFISVDHCMPTTGKGNVPQMIKVGITVETQSGEVVAKGECIRFHRKKAKDGAAWQAAVGLGLIRA